MIPIICCLVLASFFTGVELGLRLALRAHQARIRRDIRRVETWLNHPVNQIGRKP